MKGENYSYVKRVNIDGVKVLYSLGTRRLDGRSYAILKLDLLRKHGGEL